MRFPEFTEEWETKKLGEVATNVMYGMNAAATNYDGENQYIRITDIDEQTRLFCPNPLSSPDGELDNKYLLHKGDILFARTGASVGKSYLYNDKDGKIYFAGFLIRLNVRAEEDPYFIFSQTLTEKYQRWVLTMSMRSGQPGINAEEYKLLPIVIPSIQEQEKISSFLLLIDERIRTQNKIIEELKTLKSSISKKIFSQEVRFKDDNGNDYPEWESKKLGEVLEIQGGYAFKSSSFNQGNTKVIRIGDIEPRIKLQNFSGVYSHEIPNEKYIVKKNDFVMALSGATFGKVGKILDYGIAYINQRVALFKTEQCIEFFYQLVLIEDFKNYIASIPTASAQPNISNNDITNYRTAIPCIAEQQKIAVYLSSIDSKIDIESQLLQKLEEQKKFLLQQMFV